jgi:hypothetical protein
VRGGTVPDVAIILAWRAFEIATSAAPRRAVAGIAT